jgi:hypothetical protein
MEQSSSQKMNTLKVFFNLGPGGGARPATRHRHALKFSDSAFAPTKNVKTSVEYDLK